MSHFLPSDQPTRPGCPVCSGLTSTPVFTKNGFTIARCTACGLLHVSPTPSDQFLQAHYQNPAYFSGEEEQGYRNYADMRKALLPHFKRRLNLINTYQPSHGRLLDFGCAAGYFLSIAKADGWQIAGLELSHEMAQAASQDLGVTIAESLDAVHEKNFDAVTLWEVIEHLPHPVETLRQLRAHLRPNGLLMLSTPNTGHWQASREPDRWTGYRPPSHLNFFTDRTLAHTLQRAGFERVTIQRVSPLPPLTRWLRHLSAPLQRSLAGGQARHWRLALYAWRAIRVLGWGWQKVARRDDDIFTTLEAVGIQPVG